MDFKLLENIVGEKNIQNAPEALQEYAGDLSFVTPKIPSCVVKPANVNEVKKIVNWANENLIPLVPISSGAPHFRGDTIPSVEGAVIIDLRRMNKIIRINTANRVALVEPGVTFSELQSELIKSGLSVYLPLLPRSTKSVLTSALERDPITMPCIHFDSTDPMLCTEIVFGTGDSMRTGEAAGPDSLEQQWEIGKAQISPFGPTQMDPQRLVSGAQGTIGIVTWISLKCRFLSEKCSAFFIPSQTLAPLIELTYKLTRIRFTGNIFILNKINLACLTRHNTGSIGAMIDKLPAWVLFVSCEGYGPLPEEKVTYLEADLKELANDLGLKVEPEINGLSAEELANLLSAPSPEPYWKQRLKGGVGEVFFLSTLGKVPELTQILEKILRSKKFPAESVGVYIQPVVMGTSCHCEFDIYYDPSDRTEAAETQNLLEEIADKMETAGAFFSRPYHPWKDIAYRRSGDTADMQKRVKRIFDPNSILNPGKLCFHYTR